MRFSEENGDLNTLDGREKEVFEIYTRLNTANRHKMDPIPVCTIPRD
jgi:NAD+ synthase